MRSKKIIYISNVNLEGSFLPGVILKIQGQEKAFKENGFEVDLLYPVDSKKIVLKRNSGERLFFKGAREVDVKASFHKKLLQHYRVSQYGSINFLDCYNVLLQERYDAIYLRFYLPGTGLVQFLRRIKKDQPETLVLLEYPTSNTKELFSNGLVRKVTYRMNKKRVTVLNNLSDYFVTLTNDKMLWGKPAIHMSNGIELSRIEPVSVPAFSSKFIILGVASDINFYHGFDKVIRGLADYKKKLSVTGVLFRIISNPLSKNMDALKALAKDLGVESMVSFELPKTRAELAEVYQQVHLGMGTLALHRIGLMDNYSLKHREYAAFGLPFVMSKGDDHFEDSTFVLTVERDEEPLDIQAIIDFYISLRSKYPDYPQAFRKSIENAITWEAQMKDVFAAINKGKEEQPV